MIQGSPAEEKMYDMLDKRIESHEGLINLYKEVLQM
jgi:hypothetical protein